MNRWASFIFIFGFVFLYPDFVSLEYPSAQIIVWNVGQGQWITRVEKDHCLHFDFGGEFNPIELVSKTCSGRINALALSHPDKDHHNFLKSIRNRLNNICLIGPSWTSSAIKRTKANGIKRCWSEPQKTTWYFNAKTIRPKDDNFSSQIAIHKHWLITGDAPISLEKLWLQSVPKPKLITHLVLGHHGSKTSTSKELLNSLPSLKQCIASSREKKYGHPHRDVRIRVKTVCGLLRTEDWGHIHFYD
ncbi:MAG: hypothetical protein RJB66_1061 [Pseudomonadota bacterium]|jgi:competence protein ComEC